MRMRGSSTGALSRTYLHSVITEWLWHSVAEVESMFTAKLAHACMIAAMYGNPAAKIENGNDQIHDMYLAAVRTFPYMKAASSGVKGDDGMIEEWRRVNEAAGVGVDGKESGKEG